jgi:hypothetical protein
VCKPMDASASSQLTEAIQKRDLSLVIGTPEEADFWYSMDDLGILESFFDFSEKLTLKQVFARERAKELAKKSALERNAVRPSSSKKFQM